MANREVNLTKRVQTAKGWRYCPVVLSANGRVKPDTVLVDGKEERHSKGAYYIEWRENGKRVEVQNGIDQQNERHDDKPSSIAFDCHLRPSHLFNGGGYVRRHSVFVLLNQRNRRLKRCTTVLAEKKSGLGWNTAFWADTHVHACY